MADSNTTEIKNNLNVTGTLSVSGVPVIPGGESSNIVTTSITTVGNGTLTAAGIAGGQILRTGPVAAFSDATDTATAIVAALSNATVSSTFIMRIKNATAFTQTITAGSGITLPATIIVPAFSIGNYYGTLTSATAITFTHLSTQPISTGTNLTAPAITTLSTVGAGTILAANFVGGFTTRAGSQSGSPFSDTTDTAAAIIAACANLVNKIGTSTLYTYNNTTNATATILGGTGVTPSGVTVIPAGSSVQYLITYTAAATLTMVSIGVANTLSTLTNPTITGNLNTSTTSFITGSSTDGITAHSGGGSGSATALVSATNRISVCAADHDSVKAPLALGGAECVIDNDGAKILDIYPSGSDTIEDGAGPVSILSGADITLISPVTGKWYLQGSSLIGSIPAGSTLTVGSFMSGSTILLNTAAGSVATLPAATGSGNYYNFVVSTTVTSNSHKILAASVSDFLAGIVTGNTNSSGTAKCFPGGLATFHSLQMPFAGSTPSGGFVGDWFTLTDVATNLWMVKGMYGAGTTPTTPFSSATT